MTGTLFFFLGGTRSGKSRHARDLALRLGGDRVTFVATAWPGDPELDARIAAHRRDRPPAWRTVDAGTDLAATVGATSPDHVLLLDSLTLWASGVVSSGGDPRAGWDAAAAVVARRAPPTIVVSDEIGLGEVPMSAVSRDFRDDLGFLHQQIAANATTVVLCVAGLPITLKGAL